MQPNIKLVTKCMIDKNLLYHKDRLIHKVYHCRYSSNTLVLLEDQVDIQLKYQALRPRLLVVSQARADKKL